MGARRYEASLGRFSSRDLLFGEPEMPVSLNQYAYANGSPVTMWDPTGLCADPDICPPQIGFGTTEEHSDDWLALAETHFAAALMLLYSPEPDLVPLPHQPAASPGPKPDLAYLVECAAAGGCTSGGLLAFIADLVAGDYLSCFGFSRSSAGGRALSCLSVLPFGLLTKLRHVPKGLEGSHSAFTLKRAVNALDDPADVFVDVGLAEQKFGQHAAALGLHSLGAYARATRDFLARAVDEGLPTRVVAPAGKIKVFNPATNEFGVYRLSDGRAITYFILNRSDPMKYFEKQGGYLVNW
jgi:hypothetical protein